MSGPEPDELELQALSRQLDDAFETTRPRAAYEDELWLRMQSQRPAPSRIRDALAGFWNGVRAAPAVPAAAVAAVLVVVIGVSLVASNGGLPHSAGSSLGLSSATNREAPAAGSYVPGNFGRVPAPAFAASPKAGGTTVAPGPAAADYTGPMQVKWTGTLALTPTVAPVYRYTEPTSVDADQFASALGAVLRGRPSGFLGSYSAADYTLEVRGTVQSPAASPAYFIFASLSMPPLQAAGAGPQDLADLFLAQHSLQPAWMYNVRVDSSGDPIKVVYERAFNVAGYGAAYVVDFNANRYGLEVDLSANRPVLASGTLPVSLDEADYRIISGADAIRTATSFSPAAVASATPAPALDLDQAELVYVLVPAGDHSFFEPAFLFSGKLQVGSQSYTRHVLVAAIDPSQRTT